MTDGDNRGALAVTRSLGRRGHEVLVGDTHRGALAQASRYCRERVVYPDPVTSSDRFVASIAETVRARHVDVLMPVADITTFLVASHRDQFACQIPIPALSIIEHAANKVAIMETGARLGVPIPRGVVVNDPAVIDGLHLGFPVVIKPWRSRVAANGTWHALSVSFANSRDELMRDLRARPSFAFPVLLQERIDGPGVGVFACFDEGRPVALFSHRRLRERPPWGGVSVLCESVALDPQAEAYATRLLEAIQWQGPAMVEFKIDARNGAPTLMEINGRFWGSLQLAVDAGVDFPALALQTIGHGPFPAQPSYRVGIRNRWLWGDIDSLMLSLRPSTRALLPATAPSRLASVGEFLRFWGRDLHYDNPKWDDPWPWAVESAARLAAIPRRLARFASDTGRSTSSPRRQAATAPGSGQPEARTRLVGSLDSVPLDAVAWNQLVADSGVNTVFQTHQWLRSWWAIFGGDHTPLVVTASVGDRIVAIAPLFVQETLGRGRIARFIGDGRSDYCDFITGIAEPGATAALLDTVLEADGWDVLELNNVPGHSRTPIVIEAAARRHGYSVLTCPQYDCPTLLIDGYEESARSILRKPGLKRARHAFERLGNVTCRDFTAAEDIEPMLDDFFEQHVARWAEQGRSLFTDARNRQFYRAITKALSDSGWLMFSTVELNQKPIAFHFGFHYDRSLLWYKPSFDISHAARSPGLVLVHHLIDRAIAMGCRELDFTVGAEAFKRRFTNAVRKTMTVRVFRSRARYAIARSRELLRGHAPTEPGAAGE